MELPLPPAAVPLQPINRSVVLSPQLKKKMLAPQLGRVTSFTPVASVPATSSTLGLISLSGLPRRRAGRLSHLVLCQQLAPSADDQAKLNYRINEIQQKYAELQIQFSQLETDLETKRAEANLVATHNKQLTEEIEYYKKLIELLQAKISQLTLANDAPEDLHKLYQKLLKEYKVLQTNFELEKNAKLVLIDQIEFLAKENESLQTGKSVEEGIKNLIIDDENLADDDLLETELDFFDQDSLLDYTSNYEFPSGLKGPPSPDINTRYKRALLPASHKLQAETEDFVLLPLKLAGPAHKRFSCLGESSKQTSKPRRLWRRLAGHQRYSSHDLLPIQVEFEPAVSTNSRDSAFDTLNGDHIVSPVTPAPSEVSLKRLSLEDLVQSREELTRLKFELQLLRLQNEKLLSYIGYEMQRLQQHKHRETEEAPHEYLDRKLIERLREVLIKKKRVLRLVSINPLQKLATLGPNLPSFDDAYGFMAYKSDLSKRVFSNGLQAYYRLDEVDGDDDTPSVKKHTLMVFTGLVRDSDLLLDLDYDEDDEAFTDEEPDILDLIPAPPTSGVFSSFKYLMLGAPNHRRKSDELVDDGLKYKFLTIAMAITVIGLQLSHNRHH